MEILQSLFSDYTLRTVALGTAMLGIVSGALGSFAVLRRQSLLGDAMSHAALPGVILAFMLTGLKSPSILMIGAAIAGVVGVLFIIVINRYTRIKEDSSLGIVLSVFFGFCLLLLTMLQRNPDARQAGLDPRVTGQVRRGRTTAADTRRAAGEMAALGVDLLLFAGGDGTARDIYEAIGIGIPALGIPAGVKIHSGVYATTPEGAAQLAAMVLSGRVMAFGELEVMDIDEEAFRRGQVSARLYGYLKVPLERRFTQGVKAASANSAHESAAIQSIADQIVETMEAGWLYIIGSGTTPRAVMELLDLPNTLLGIDAVRDGKLVAADLNETRLLKLIDHHATRIVVTPIGGQAYIFGRGNQQLSPAVIKKIGLQNIIVAATPGKLASLQRRPLLVDTGDRAIDEMLRGYIRVVTGYREEMVYRVS